MYIIKIKHFLNMNSIILTELILTIGEVSKYNPGVRTLLPKNYIRIYTCRDKRISVIVNSHFVTMISPSSAIELFSSTLGRLHDGSIHIPQYEFVLGLPKRATAMPPMITFSMIG